MVFEHKKVYSWAGMERKVSAQKVGEHLEAIEQRDGAVTKESFLESARPIVSPMHPLFEWDDEKAAEKYRLQQSNQIINSLRIEVVNASGDEQEARYLSAYVNIENRGNGKAQFINIQSAMGQEETKDQVFANALRDLRWLQNKYGNFVWFAPIAEQIALFLDEQEGE